MASKTNSRELSRLKRKKRIRKKLSGNPERPRLTVFRSDKHIYAQIIDDTARDHAGRGVDFICRIQASWIPPRARSTLPSGWEK